MVKITKRDTQAEISKERVRALKAEISKKASMANKRLTRLEKNNLQGNFAYQQFLEYGGERFSVKGKTYNELQKELSRVNHFINAETSTVRGTTKVLKNMAENVGLKYDTTKELLSSTSKFFELASKVEQYLDNTSGSGQAVGYQKIWQTINQYVNVNKISLADNENNIDEMIKVISDLVSEQTKQDNMNDLDNFFFNNFNF